MSRRFIGLSKRLLLAAMLAVAVALCAFTAVQSAGYSLIDRQLEDEAFMRDIEAKFYKDLQARVTRAGISSADTAALNELARSAGAYALYVIRDGRVLFDSMNQISGYLSDDLFLDDQSSPITFADGEALVAAYFDPAERSYFLVYTLSWVLAAVCFIALFTLLVRRRIGYVLTLEREMHVLEGGDLKHPVPVTGSDELSLLAGSINEMRLSVLERQEAQEQAEAAGRGLVASMSHDLRTPLTALIGYLELIGGGKYETEEQRKKFEASALEKAYRIKTMTDELFGYALGRLGDKRSVETDPVEMSLFLQQVIADEQFDLGESGLFLQWTDNGTGYVRIAPERLLRVFDNLFSNARKYAAPTSPVRLSWSPEGAFFRVDMLSAVRKGAAKGTGLGLASCAAIVEAAGGAIQTREENGFFHVALLLPLWRKA